MALVNCPECKKDVSNKAKLCPHCGYKMQKRSGCLPMLGIVILISLAIVVIDANINSEVNTSNSPRKDYTSERLAYNLSKDYVLENIKSPSSADFPGLFESKNHVKDLGGGRFEVNSWVDSENSFGAKIRTRYSCIMIKRSNDRWGIENLKFH